MTRRHSSSTVLLASLMIVLSTVKARAQDFDAAGEAQMLARINAMRSEQGLAPLARDPGLDAAARAHSADMASQGALTHVSEQSGTPADRVRAAGVTATTIAENVALHRSAAEAHETLVGSEPHLANMMNAEMTHVGLAALPTEAGVYVTQVFAALPPPAPVVEPAVVAPTPPTPVEAAPVEAAPVEADPVEAPEQPDADCINPIPGVRLCGRLPAPSVQQVEPPRAPPVVAAPNVAPPAVAPPAVAAPAPNLQVQPGTNGTVVIQRSADDARVEGYWVYGSGRWWYYPRPAGAQAGHRLQPDMRVSGPPPGFPAHPNGAPQQATPRPRAWRVAPPAPTRTQITVAPSTRFYAVPPPPMTGTPDRNWRRAHRRWMRAYRRWLRDQARLRRRAL